MRSVISRFAHLLRIDGFMLLLFALGVLGTGIVLLRQHVHGPYFSIDAMHYLAIARSLSSGYGWVSFEGSNPANWPPGFSVLMVLGSLFIFDPRDVVGPLNAVALGLTVFITGSWLRGRIKSRFLVLWGCLALVFSIPLVWVATYALSESVFILFLILSLVYAERFLVSESRSSLILLGLFGCLVCLLRYSGVAVVLVIAVLMAFSHGSSGLGKLRRIGVYLSISLLPLCLWMIRNVLVTGTFTGNRIQHEVRLLEDVYLVLKVLTVWLFQVPLPARSPLYSEPVLPFDGMMLWFALLCACVLMVVLLSVTVRIFFRCRSGGAKLRGRVFVLVAGGIGLAYFGLLILQPAILSTVTVVAEFLFPSYTQDREEATIVQTPISTRYVAPLYIPLVVVAVYFLDRLVCIVREREWLLSLGRLPLVRLVARGRPMRIRVMSPILVVGLSVWILYAGYASALVTREAIVGEGSGYSAKFWYESDTIEWVRTHLRDEVIFSNEAHYVYINGGGHRFVYYLAQDQLPFVNAGSLQGRPIPAGDDVYIVWLYYGDSEYSYGAADLRLRVSGLEMVAEFSDGLVFRVNSSHDPSDAYDAFVASYDSVIVDRFVLRLVFDIYIGDDELHYVKEPCEESDIASSFFLHVHPVDVSDLPDRHRVRGLDNLDFNFSDWGIRFDGKCLASVPLPDYPISRISTGQFIYDEGGYLWSVRWFDGTTFLALNAFQELVDKDIEPVFRSMFDVYLDEGKLIYLKSQCSDEYRDARFFLHVRPADESYLREERREYGFDNLDFDFWEFGGNSDGDCFAVVELPEYEIAHISTGQFTRDGRVWSEELYIGGD